MCSKRPSMTCLAEPSLRATSQSPRDFDDHVWIHKTTRSLFRMLPSNISLPSVMPTWPCGCSRHLISNSQSKTRFSIYLTLTNMMRTYLYLVSLLRRPMPPILRIRKLYAGRSVLHPLSRKATVHVSFSNTRSNSKTS